MRPTVSITHVLTTDLRLSFRHYGLHFLFLLLCFSGSLLAQQKVQIPELMQCLLILLLLQPFLDPSGHRDALPKFALFGAPYSTLFLAKNIVALLIGTACISIYLLMLWLAGLVTCSALADMLTCSVFALLLLVTAGNYLFIYRVPLGLGKGRVIKKQLVHGLCLQFGLLPCFLIRGVEYARAWHFVLIVCAAAAWLALTTTHTPTASASRMCDTEA